MKERYFYPVVYAKETYGISIRFPDIDGLLIQAPSVEIAFNAARYALHLYIKTLIETRSGFPAESLSSSIKYKQNEFVGMMAYDATKPAATYSEYVSMPAWLKEVFAKNSNNLTQELRAAQFQHLDEPF